MFPFYLFYFIFGAHRGNYVFIKTKRIIFWKKHIVMSTYEQLQSLARIILPEEIIENFDIVGIEEKSGVIHILLDEQAIPP